MVSSLYLKKTNILYLKRTHILRTQKTTKDLHSRVITFSALHFFFSDALTSSNVKEGSSGHGVMESRFEADLLWIPKGHLIP